MDYLKLRLEPDVILRKKCVKVEQIDRSVFDLVNGMIACMEHFKGIGLAASQVGQTHRLFVTHAPNDIVRVFINPTILFTSLEEVEVQEGCLSIPTIFATLSRARDITVQAHDQHGTPFRIDASGMLARVVLHEYDHLDGILFWDYLSSKKRKKIEKKYHAR